MFQHILSNWKTTEEESKKPAEVLESYSDLKRVIPICETHSKDKWMSHEGYNHNPDGTITCQFCGWGTPLPGYMRLINGKVVDLRDTNKSA